MKRILITGVMILVFAGGAVANNGSSDNGQDKQSRERITIAEHAKCCSKEMNAVSDVGAKQNEVKKGDKSEGK